MYVYPPFPLHGSLCRTEENCREPQEFVWGEANLVQGLGVGRYDFAVFPPSAQVTIRLPPVAFLAVVGNKEGSLWLLLFHVAGARRQFQATIDTLQKLTFCSNNTCATSLWGSFRSCLDKGSWPPSRVRSNQVSSRLSVIDHQSCSSARLVKIRRAPYVPTRSTASWCMCHGRRTLLLLVSTTPGSYSIRHQPPDQARA